MTQELTQMQCEVCRVGAPKVTAEEAVTYRKQIPAWNIVAREGIQHLEHVYTFSDFASALSFTNKVGTLAEAEGHHPALLTEWGKVTVAWWTHKIGGLHRNDFIMAAKTDEIYQESVR